MTDVETVSQNEQKRHEIISFEEEVEFKYTLPDEEEPRSIEQELTFLWEDSLEKFIEEYGADKPYKVHSFKREKELKFFMDQIEGRTDDAIEEVEETIANKMKFGFEFSGQLHNDD
jgi:hypothetical protein